MTLCERDNFDRRYIRKIIAIMLDRGAVIQALSSAVTRSRRGVPKETELACEKHQDGHPLGAWTQWCGWEWESELARKAASTPSGKTRTSTALEMLSLGKNWQECLQPREMRLWRDTEELRNSWETRALKGSERASVSAKPGSTKTLQTKRGNPSKFA